jgi:rhodanese-related sulfurtransferase
VDTAFSIPISISPQELAARLGRPDAPLLLDVRRREKFDAAPTLLAGAQYCAPEEVAHFAQTQTPREVVVYCVFGHNVSADAVATLRAAGWPVRMLAGGIAGGEDGVDSPADIAQWRSQTLPLVTKRAGWGVTGTQPSRWITRERPKIDRIACPWLIRRFVDPRASFFYVPTPQVFSEAERLGAVAYDIPGAPVSHVGELCSFDALLQGVGLVDAALQRLATIVRAADTDRLDLAPQAAGLLAVSLGMSRTHTDDHAMLEAMLPVYDALYAWCADAVVGQNERHNWKPEASQ